MNKNFRMSGLWGVFRTFSLSLSDEQIFFPSKNTKYFFSQYSFVYHSIPENFWRYKIIQITN